MSAISQPAKPRTLLSLAIALLCLCVLATYLSFTFFRSSERWVAHTQEVRAVLGDLEATISEAGRMRMSYLLSGNESNLTEYRTAVARIAERMRELQALTSDNQTQREPCDRLASITHSRLRVWENSIAERQQGQSVDLSSLLRQNVDSGSQGAAAAEAIRMEETRLLDQRTKAAQLRFFLASALMFSSFILALLLLYLYHRMLSAELEGHEKSEQKVREAYLREAELRRNEERFRLFVEAVEDYAIFVLDAAGNVGSWNKGAERLKGYAASEILGKHFSCFYPEVDVANGKPEWELDAATKEGRIEDEGWRIRKDGSQFWANVVITATRDEQGRVIGFTKVTRDFTERRQAQEALLSANTDLATEVAEKRSAEKRLAISERSLRGLSLRLLRMQDEERRRIGRDLHDSLGQYLAVLKMNLDSLESVLNSGSNGTGRDVAQCARLAGDAIKELRTISYLLYPPMLEEMGLKSAIPWYLDGFSKRSNIQTTFVADPEFGRLPAEVELALFRILQESLTNVHRHSGSSTATIRLSMEDGTALLEVRDMGKGIPLTLLEQSNEDWMGSLGVGLRGMNERMRQLGGKLEVSSTESGTVVVASVPVGEPFSAMTRSA